MAFCVVLLRSRSNVRNDDEKAHGRRVEWDQGLCGAIRAILGHSALGIGLESVPLPCRGVAGRSPLPHSHPYCCLSREQICSFSEWSSICGTRKITTRCGGQPNSGQTVVWLV